jgi:hypothetical protein
MILCNSETHPTTIGINSRACARARQRGRVRRAQDILKALSDRTRAQAFRCDPTRTTALAVWCWLGFIQPATVSAGSIGPLMSEFMHIYASVAPPKALSADLDRFTRPVWFSHHSASKSRCKKLRSPRALRRLSGGS